MRNVDVSYRFFWLDRIPDRRPFAADLSLQYSLPMADAIVYATAMEEGCKIVTSDAHFKGLDKVVFV